MSNNSIGENRYSIRSIRDLTLKPRFLQTYGTDEDYYNKSLRYIKYWSTKLFCFNETELKSHAEEQPDMISSPTIVNDILMLRDIETIGKTELLVEELGLDSTAIVELKGSSNNLEWGSKVKLNTADRPGLVLNVGGTIIGSSWCPNSSTGRCFLAILVVANGGDVNNLITHEELSIFYTVGPSSRLKTCIQIWEFNPESGEATLTKLWDISKFGACTNLSWSPILSPEMIGLLTGIFKDGKIHLLKVVDSGPKFETVKETTKSYELKDCSNRIIPFLSYDFLLNDRIIVGAVDGTVSEFMLPISKEEHIDIPSFTYQVVESSVSFITVANPSPNKYLIHTNSYGTQSVVFDYDNFSNRRLESFDSVLKPVYHKGLKLFICTDGNDTAAFGFTRNPQERQALILKTDGLITSYGVSKYLNHPLLLVGNSFGEVYIVNFARKVLSQAKVSNKFLVPLRLMKFKYKGKNKVEIDDNLEPVAAESNTRLTVSPQEITISSLSWNETLHGSSIYAAGTHLGLVIIGGLCCK